MWYLKEETSRSFEIDVNRIGGFLKEVFTSAGILLNISFLPTAREEVFKVTIVYEGADRRILKKINKVIEKFSIKD